LINFAIVSFSIFLVIKFMNHLRKTKGRETDGKS
jgi:large-conductance mechanosensitive channel